MRFVAKPAAGPLSGTLDVPGDKSISHRAVIVASIAEGRAAVRGIGDGADNRATALAFAQLGVSIQAIDDGLVIEGVGLDGLQAPGGAIDCGNSGTGIRLLCGLLAPQRFGAELTGDVSLRGRPMRRVIAPLAQMGARFEGASGALAGELYPPLQISPVHGLRGIDYAMPIASAQVKSALVLAALYAEGVTRVTEPGPSRDHTERMLRFVGAPVRSEPGGVTVVEPGGWDRRLPARDLTVPGDPSSAAFLLAAALVAGAEEVRVRRVCVNPTRTGFLDALAAMGAEISRDAQGQAGGEPVADLIVRGPRRPTRAAVIQGELLVRCIDEVPVLAVVAALGAGQTRFADAGELRVKESDRIATTAAMLRAFGVEVEEEPEGFVVTGRDAPLAAARVHAHGDHRIAMAAAVAALAAAGESIIDDVDNVATSYPGFATALRSLGADLT